MKYIKLFVLSTILLFSCSKQTDEIETIEPIKKTHATSDFCKNEDNSIFKTYLSVEGKDEAKIKADLQFEMDLLSKMNVQFRQDQNNDNKVLYLKTSPSVWSTNGIVQEWLISIHVSDNPLDPVLETTRTIYTGDEAGAKAKKLEIYWQNIWNLDPCAPYAIFEWDGVWYLEDCC